MSVRLTDGQLRTFAVRADYPLQDAATELLALRERVTKLEEALEEARGIAKTFWLVHRHTYIADADALCSMCEGISDAIAALKERAALEHPND
jgi:hypothetical protein